VGILPGVALAVVAWPVRSLSPGGGIDESYVLALHMAAQMHLQAGRDYIFPEGPLGFIAYPRSAFAATAVVSVAGYALVFAASAVVVLRMLHRAVPWPVALPVGFVLVRLLSASVALPELLAVLIVVVALDQLVLADEPPRRAALLVIGLMTATAILMKFSTGVFAVVAVVGFGVAAARRQNGSWRPLRVAALASVCWLVVLDVVAGQNPGNLPTFMVRSVEIVRGYPNAMGIEVARRRYEYALAVLGLLAVGVLAARDGRCGRGWSRTIAGSTLFVVVWLMFRQGFIRHDAHSLSYFGALIVLVLVFASRQGRWLFFGSLVVVSGIVVSVSGVGVGDLVGPTDGIRSAWTTMASIADSATRTRLMGDARSHMQADYRLTADELALLGGHSVHVDPWETALVWAYPTIRWRPVPIFQPYQAYTSVLDDINAEFLDRPDGPDFVLQEPGAVDIRAHQFESPRYMLALVCNYRYARSSTRFTILQHDPQRCGQPERLSEATLDYGQSVAVPAGPGIVVASFDDFDQSLADSLLPVVFRARPLTITLQGVGAYRFIPGHADHPHIVAVPTCARTSPQTVASTKGISVTEGPADPGRVDPSRRYRVTFSRIPYRC
jgi:hypothetical protein